MVFNCIGVEFAWIDMLSYLFTDFCNILPLVYHGNLHSNSHKINLLA